jgi:hypothetical protein
MEPNALFSSSGALRTLLLLWSPTHSSPPLEPLRTLLLLYSLLLKFFSSLLFAPLISSAPLLHLSFPTRRLHLRNVFSPSVLYRELGEQSHVSPVKITMDIQFTN